MNKNLYANMKAFAECKRNPFPLDFSVTYSEKLGEITPIKCLHTIPNDFFEVSMAEKALSFPLNTSAFLAARKEIAVYHVPYNHVCSLFNQMQASRPDPKTSALVNLDDLTGGEKGIWLAQLYWATFQMHMIYCFVKYINPLYLDTDIFGDNPPTLLFSGSDLCWTFPSSPAPTAIWFNDVIPSDYNTIFSLIAGTYLVDLKNGYDILRRPRAYGYCRKLDLLGYGNLYPILRKVESVFETVAGNHTGGSTFTTEEAASIATALRVALLTIGQMSFASFEYSRDGSGVATITTMDNPRIVSLYPILSYNKCFYEFFRNSIYDLDYKVTDYNMDWAYNVNGAAPIIYITDFSFRFLDIEYHQYKKDLITGSYPSPQFGAVSEININPSISSLIEGVGGGAPFIQTGSDLERWTNVDGDRITNGATILGSVNGSGSNLYDSNASRDIGHDHQINQSEVAAKLKVISSASASFNVIDLKRAEMLQEYRQVLLRNGNRTGDLFKGIYGSRPASEEDNAPRFVDVFGTNIFVDTIVSTADTASDQKVGGHLGDLGARAVISNGGKFKFKTSDFGCLLFLTYIVPENEYSSVMLDENLLALDPETHFLPFFQNLGFQPIYGHNVNLYGPENVRGYAPSYSRLKQVLPTAHGNFVSIKSPAPFVDYNNIAGAGVQSLIDSGFYDDFVGSFNHWVALCNQLQNLDTTTLAQFYISPSMWDNVFVTAAGADYESDHFVCRSRFNIKSVRILSKLGLPNF